MGTMPVATRLSDALNRREPLLVESAAACALDDPAGPVPEPGLLELDPYELVVVMVGLDSLPADDPGKRAAMRVRRLPYGVTLDLGVATVFGTVHMHPGTDPRRLRDARSELFFPVTDAVVRRGDRVLGGPWVHAVLVSRPCLRSVEGWDPLSGLDAARATTPAAPPTAGRESD